MIVSKENIIKAGIDPSLVSDTDLIRIGDFVDKLNASKLDSLLQALDKDDDKVIKLKTFSLKVKIETIITKKIRIDFRIHSSPFFL